ncbi:MAG: pH regulation protein F [Rhodobacteraceae bacterium]|nr:MAG: pH regulation protein F [Paracoccaceae bacterium]|tara:strand:- start:394 stop:696 length:303 start_codon:yes stop_codon:yes gene_type:complete
MFEVCLIVLLICVIILLWRVYIGPTLYDRVIAVNSIGTLAVLIIGVVGFLTERPDFLDIALLYALINFIGTIAVLKFFRYKMVDAGQKLTNEKSGVYDDS